MQTVCLTTCFYLALFLHSIVLAQNYDPLEGVNSVFNEENPILNPEGNILFFTRGHHPENVGGSADKGDIWFSVLQEDRSWSQPRNARTLNNTHWNGVIGFQSDGKIVLHGHYKSSGELIRTQGIAVAENRGTSWKEPVNITIPYYRNLSENQGGSITQDGSALLLAMEGYGTRGAEDIYVCLKLNDGGWSEPKNLGATINTPYQEFTPFMSKDNKTLYFSSNGHKGTQGTDIFVSSRLDDSWRNWSEPRPLAHINTEGRELGYRQYEGFAIYASTRDSDGYGDLKVYTEVDLDSLLAQKTLVEVDTTVQLTEVPEEQVKETDNQFVLFGQVYDKASERTLANATVTITSKEDSFSKTVSPSGGKNRYSLGVPADDNYIVRIDAPGYLSHQQNLDVFSDEVKVLEMNFGLQVISVGARVNLENVLFKQSKPEIVSTSYAELNMVADLMKQNPSMVIRLEGHTDNRGDAKQNMKLSQERVHAVKKYLLKRGINKKRVKGKGYGGARPLVDNNDPVKRKLNRRVEFTILKE